MFALKIAYRSCSETATTEHPDRYFDIVDALTDPSSTGLLGPITETVHKPKYVYQTALALLQARGFLTEPHALSAYEKNLALHSAAPKIQAFYQLIGDASKSPECGSWIEWDGKQVCGPAEVEELLGTNSNAHGSPRLFSFDHVQKRDGEACSKMPVFYASPSSPNFYPLLSYLRSKTEQPGFCYAMRYTPPKNSVVSGEQDRNVLSGYGVALDLKVRGILNYLIKQTNARFQKMDYLALDDRGPRGQGGEDDQSATESIAWEDYVSTLLSEHTDCPSRYY